MQKLRSGMVKPEAMPRIMEARLQRVADPLQARP
jgi:hypothetical protein